MSLSKRKLKAVKLIAEGNKTVEEIAQECKVSRQSIYNWKKNEEFKKAIDDFEEELREDIKHKLISMSPKALKEFNKLLSARSEMVRFQAIKDLFDRIGMKPVEKQEIKQEIKAEVEETINDKELEELLAGDTE